MIWSNFFLLFTPIILIYVPIHMSDSVKRHNKKFFSVINTLSLLNNSTAAHIDLFKMAVRVCSSCSNQKKNVTVRIFFILNTSFVQITILCEEIIILWERINYFLGIHYFWVGINYQSWERIIILRERIRIVLTHDRSGASQLTL